MPRRCSSGTTMSTKSSRPPLKYGGRTLKPSQAPVVNQFSISSATSAGVPTIDECPRELAKR